MKVSLIIPAYNEAERIAPFLKSVADWQNQHPNQFHEIIVVDDGSTDSTAAIAQTLEVEPLRLIRHEKNRGKGAAVQTGVFAATGDYIVFMDADGATSIDQLPKMENALQNHDVGIGNRWMPGAKTERHSVLRRLSGWIYRKYMALFGLGDIDTMCGFKGYRRAVARDLLEDLQEERWLFDTEIAYKAFQRGYSVKNFPINWESKDGSKLDTRTLLNTAFQIWPLINKIKTQTR